MFPAGVPVLSVQHPGQLAQLVGDTAREMLVGVSQVARRLRRGGQIVVPQVGIGTKLASCRRFKRVNGVSLTSLRGGRRITVDEARIE